MAERSRVRRNYGRVARRRTNRWRWCPRRWQGGFHAGHVFLDGDGRELGTACSALQGPSRVSVHSTMTVHSPSDSLLRGNSNSRASALTAKTVGGTPDRARARISRGWRGHLRPDSPRRRRRRHWPWCRSGGCASRGGRSPDSPARCPAIYFSTGNVEFSTDEQVGAVLSEGVDIAGPFHPLSKVRPHPSVPLRNVLTLKSD